VYGADVAVYRGSNGSSAAAAQPCRRCRNDLRVGYAKHRQGLWLKAQVVGSQRGRAKSPFPAIATSKNVAKVSGHCGNLDPQRKLIEYLLSPLMRMKDEAGRER